MTRQRSGIYGLFRLDGGPVDPRDAAALGLSPPARDTSAIVEPVDQLEPANIHQTRVAAGTSILLGHVDDQAALATRLGLSRDTPPLVLALAALDRFGDALPREMMGIWSLLHWDADRRRLHVVQSINYGATFLFTRRGPLLAIAPDLQQLLRLSWVSSDLDTDDIIHSHLSGLLHHRPDHRLFVRGIHFLGSGRSWRVDADGESLRAADPHLPVTPWQGDFHEAIAAGEAILRADVRRTLATAPALGAFNSGGLDSSLLSWMASSEKPAGRVIPLLASAVDPDRGLPDELPFSRIVADHLGEPLYAAVPLRSANPFRPRMDDFMAAHRPPQSPRHYLYDSFKDQAKALGLTHVLDGSAGEFTFTSPMELPNWRRRIHLQLRAMRMRFTHPDLRPRWPDDAVTVWLHPDLMAAAGDTARDMWSKPNSQRKTRRRGELWGYSPALAMMVNRGMPDMLNGEFKQVMPFLNIRLQQLFAGFPTDYAGHGGLDRSPARHLLRGQLPDSIRLRPKGLAFSPDYYLRLREHAAAAATRIPLFRKAGLGEWFDLDRLEAGLGQIHRFERAQLHFTFKVQMTAQTCEFFLWWLNGRPATEVAG